MKPLWVAKRLGALTRERLFETLHSRQCVLEQSTIFDGSNQSRFRCYWEPTKRSHSNNSNLRFQTFKHWNWDLSFKIWIEKWSQIGNIALQLLTFSHFHSPANSFLPKYFSRWKKTCRIRSRSKVALCQNKSIKPEMSQLFQMANTSSARRWKQLYL